MGGSLMQGGKYIQLSKLGGHLGSHLTTITEKLSEGPVRQSEMNLQQGGTQHRSAMLFDLQCRTLPRGLS